MFSFLFFAVLCASSLAKPAMVRYSFSPPVGSAGGSSYVTEGEGRITAVRVWEQNNAYIRGIQLRYGYIWSPLVGNKHGTESQIDLFDDEVITQVSGKYHSNYIYQVIFGTSRGRFLMAGQPTQNSFNFYPKHPEAELKMLSGRYNGNGITTLGAHWGVREYNSTDLL